MRAHEIAEVWKAARLNVLCTGVGMTGIVDETDLIRDTVARGVRVEFVLVDPKWVAASKALSRAMDDFYGRKNFAETIRASLVELVELRDNLNSEFGVDRVVIRTCKTILHYSGTIADFGTRGAQGYIEFHLYRSPLGRFRLKVQDYEDADRPSLVYHWLSSYSRLAKTDYLRPLRSASQMIYGTAVAPIKGVNDVHAGAVDSESAAPDAIGGEEQ